MPVLRNPKHERFAQEYAKTGNARQSYISAGYSENGAEVSGCRLLSDANVALRVAELRERISDGVVKREITQRNARVQVLEECWNKLRAVIEARAADPSMESVPGGKTGMLVRQLKQIGTGRNAQVVEEYAVDTGLLKELRAHSQQAAQELGQWVDKRSIEMPKPLEEMTYDELTSFAGRSDSSHPPESIN